MNTMMLHADSLVLPHPVSGEIITLRAELPEEFERMLKELKF
jgi:23S rRNA-/tRNA-specific pseudouridylate synthase